MRVVTKLRPRTKPPEARLHELMGAAQHLFLKHGVSSTTIEQITSDAGVAKGTFYLYFSSKEDVREALRHRFAQNLLAGIKVAVAARPKDDWKGKLATWASACVGGYLDSIRLHDIVFYENRPRARRGLVDNIVIDSLFELLRAGAHARAWSIASPRYTAVFLFSGLHGLIDHAHSGKKTVKRTRLARLAEQLCLNAVELGTHARHAAGTPAVRRRPRTMSHSPRDILV
jgi:AcrR family transcriptional regulator